MACFLAPAAEAVVTTVLQKKLDQKEKEAEHGSVEHIENAQSIQESTKPKHKISWSRKLKWLNTMLWGGSALLCVEHIWHGEVVPWPPFLTAMQTPSEIVPMLKEIALYGTTMAVVITGVWFGMTLIEERLARKNVQSRRYRECI